MANPQLPLTPQQRTQFAELLYKSNPRLLTVDRRGNLTVRSSLNIVGRFWSWIKSFVSDSETKAVRNAVSAVFLSYKNDAIDFYGSPLGMVARFFGSTPEGAFLVKKGKVKVVVGWDELAKKITPYYRNDLELRTLIAKAEHFANGVRLSLADGATDVWSTQKI